MPFTSPSLEFCFSAAPRLKITLPARVPRTSTSSLTKLIRFIFQQRTELGSYRGT